MARFGSICAFHAQELALRFQHRSSRRVKLTILPSKKCSRTMTILTDFGSSNVKNANPLDFPEVGSRMMLQSRTLPNSEKYFLRPSEVILLSGQGECGKKRGYGMEWKRRSDISSPISSCIRRHDHPAPLPCLVSVRRKTNPGGRLTGRRVNQEKLNVPSVVSQLRPPTNIFLHSSKQ